MLFYKNGRQKNVQRAYSDFAWGDSRHVPPGMTQKARDKKKEYLAEEISTLGGREKIKVAPVVLGSSLAVRISLFFFPLFPGYY